MEQTTQKHYFIKKNTAILDKKSFEGRCLLSALTNKEQFLDYLEDIYEDLKPDTVETLGTYDKMFIAEHEYQAVKDLEVKVKAETGQVFIIWSTLEDEDGTIYGKSFFKNEKLEHVLDVVGAFDRADQQTQDEVMNLLRQNQISL